MKKIIFLFSLLCIAIAHAQTAPTTAPTAPIARNASDVISIYGGGDNGNSYTNIASVNYNPNWGQATQQTEETINSNKVLKYATFNYQGTDWVNATNVTSMQYLHVDIWTDAQTPRVWIISKTTGDGNSYTFTSKTGQWQSVDIPLTSFTGSKTDVYQFKFDNGPGTLASIIYLDNLYFYKVPTGSDANLSDLKVSGTTVTGFSASTTSYTVTVPFGTTTVPTVTATTNDATATKVITPASTISGTTTVVVTSQNGTVTKTYTVAFQVAAANTACSGTDTSAGFTTGYTYSFTTVSSTSVKVTFVVLDADKNTANGDMQFNGGGFVGLTRTGATYTTTITGLTNGQSYTFMGHFVNGNGAYSTKTYTYKVGTDCTPDTFAPTSFTVTKGVITTSSVELLLNSTDATGPITYTVTYGAGLTATTTSPSGTQKSFVINNLTPVTAYNFSVTASDAIAPPNTTTAIQVSATTLAGADTTAPTVFTATVGAITSTSVELLLNATDDSTGTITYNVTGSKTATTTSPSGTQKSLIITGLSASTAYSFNVVASDATGNATSAIVVPATTAADTTAPTGFTATVGTISSTTVQLVLNGTDDSGTVTYNVTGGATISTTSPSGTQKTLTISGLTPATAYTFTVTATDASGNAATAKVLNATTDALNTTCAGKTNATTSGSFPTGYKYTFTTTGSGSTATVTAVFELLDNLTGIVPPSISIGGTARTVTTITAGTKYSATATNLTVGNTVSIYGSFVWASGGNATTTAISYIVGDICDTTAPTGFTATIGAITPTTVELLLNSTDISGPITYNVTGGKTASTTSPSGTQKSLIISGLTSATAYNFSVTAKDTKNNTTSAIALNATTLPAPLDTQAPTNFTATVGAITPTSIELLLNGTDDFGFVNYDVTYNGGQTATATNVVSGTQKSLIITGLTPGKAYDFSVEASDDADNKATNNPIVVSATTTDIQAPTSFTATVGATTPTSIELLLNGIDDSLGTITYTVSGGITATTTSASGTAKSFVISGLTPATLYNFSVTASDALGNAATPIALSATSDAVPTACAGKETNTGFITGYTYSFTTLSPTSVKVTFVVLDTTGGIVGSNGDMQLNGAGFVGLARTGSSTYTATVTGLTSGQTCTFMGHFVWAGGGTASTKTYTYTVGDICDIQAPTGFTATVGAVTSTTVELLLNGSDNSGFVTYDVTYNGGQTATATNVVSGTQKSLIISDLTPATAYNFSVTAKDAKGNVAANTIPLSATTGAPIDSEAPTNFSASVGEITPTSIELLLSADDNSGSVTYIVTYNGITISAIGDSGTEKSIIINNLTPATTYSFNMVASDALNNVNINDSFDFDLATACINTTSEETASACDTYTWESGNGQTYTESGDYTNETTIDGGCTNTATLHLTIKNSSSHTTTATACDSYTWVAPLGNGQTYTSSQTGVTNTSTNAAGCTHTETLNLTITPSTSHTTTVSTCDTYTWSAGNGQTYTESGNYPYVNGCHTETLALAITPSTSHTTTVSTCDTYTWSAGDGQTYTESGNYPYVNGCHTETLALTITPSTSHTTTLSYNGASYIWPVNGENYTSNGTYSSVSGCHTEILELTLIICTNTTSEETVSACDNYVWSANGQTYLNSGDYTNVTTITGGCTNTATLHLTINSATAIATQPSNPTICKLAGATASATVATTGSAVSTYQWYVKGGTVALPTWTALTDNANYSGSTSATLNITRTTTAVPATGTKYHCVVTGSDCAGASSLTTDDITLQEQSVLSKAPAIKVTSVLKPTLTVCNGGTVSFSAAAGSVGVVEWQQSTDNATWNTVQTETPGTPNPLYTFTSSALSTGDVYFRTKASNGSCASVASASVKITVSPTAVAGSIALSDSTPVCAFQKVSTTVLTEVDNNSTLTLSGNTGTVTWYKSTNYVNATGAAPKWAAIKTSVANATTGLLPNPNYIVSGTTLTVKNLLKNEWYKAVVTSGACTVSTLDTTAPTLITVTPVAKAGALTASKTSVCYGGDITIISAAFTGSSITWLYSTTSATANDFAPIPGQTGTTTLNLSNVTYVSGGSKFYVKALVVSGACTQAYSAVKTIMVDKLSAPGTVTGGKLICSGAGAKLTLAGNVGKPQWQSSTDNDTWTDISGAIAATYTAASVTSTTYYRARSTSGDCSVAYSNSVALTVGTSAVAGTITAGADNICPTLVGGTTLTLSGSVGTIQWQKALVSKPSVWANTGTGLATLSTGTLTASTMYRAIVYVGDSATSNCSNDTAAITVNVISKPVAKSISVGPSSPAGSASAPLCISYATKVLTIPAGSVGNIQWQKSTTSISGGFTNIEGATGNTYTINSASEGANYFKAVFSNGCSNDVASAVVTVYYAAGVCTATDGIAASNTTFKTSNAPAFGVKAYPNPYAETFKLDVTTSSEEAIRINVYDMVGKQLESREYKANEISTEEIGSNYPSGVYNVIVSQGSEVKTVRIVKR